jgi:hypothetical protein
MSFGWPSLATSSGLIGIHGGDRVGGELLPMGDKRIGPLASYPPGSFLHLPGKIPPRWRERGHRDSAARQAPFKTLTK